MSVEPYEIVVWRDGDDALPLIRQFVAPGSLHYSGSDDWWLREARLTFGFDVHIERRGAETANKDDTPG